MTDLDLIREAIRAWNFTNWDFPGKQQGVGLDARIDYHNSIPAFRRVLLRHVRCETKRYFRDSTGDRSCENCGTCDDCKLIELLKEER